MPVISNQTEENTFIPRRFLRNAHLQTLAGNFLRRENRLPEPQERLFQVEENVQVLCHCHWQPEPQSRATVLIVHGLEGSSLSQYVIGTGSKAWELGMNVVRTLLEQEKLQRIGLVGYSMGGNLVLKLAGEWGSNAPPELKAVAAVSPSADLAASADAIHEKANRVYEWKFLLSLMRRYRRKCSLFPEIYRKTRLPRSIRDFDDLIIAPYNGFAGAQDYYDRASASRVADKIVVPTLVVHSTDDPFIRMLPETRAKFAANPHVTLVETQRGGHCAFLAHPNGYDGRWAERQIIQFFLRHGMA